MINVIFHLLSIFQLLRDKIYVRVGGGWIPIELYLAKNDPCRKKKEGNQDFEKKNNVSETIHFWENALPSMS